MLVTRDAPEFVSRLMPFSVFSFCMLLHVLTLVFLWNSIEFLSFDLLFRFLSEFYARSSPIKQYYLQTLALVVYYVYVCSLRLSECIPVCEK